MEKRPNVILLQGHPCSGKTALLKLARNKLQIPSVSRDELKEFLFDQFGVGDRDWSIKLGQTSWELFFRLAEQLFLSRGSFIMESNFNPDLHGEKIEQLAKMYNYVVLEVILEADPKILFSRFKLRWESGERHRGHVDHERYCEFESLVRKRSLEPLTRDARVIRIDTSNFERIDWAEVVSEMEKMVK